MPNGAALPTSVARAFTALSKVSPCPPLPAVLPPVAMGAIRERLLQKLPPSFAYSVKRAVLMQTDIEVRVALIVPPLLVSGRIGAELVCRFHTARLFSPPTVVRFLPLRDVSSRASLR